MMENIKKGFLSASKSEMYKISHACFSNACNLYNSAIDLEEKNQISLGISLRVLAIEELMKSLVLLLENKNLGVRNHIKDFHKFFSSHEYKLSNLSSLYYSVWFIKILMDAEDKGLQPEDLSDDIELLLDLCTWIEKSDMLKQHGFYVGYCEVDKLVQSPSTFAEIDYRNARMISGNLIRLFKKVFDELDERESLAFLAYVQTVFLEKSKLKEG